MGYKPNTIEGNTKKRMGGSGKDRTPAQKGEDEKSIPKKKEPHKK